MNSIQAKQIDLNEFLSKIGFKHNSKKGSELWYISPLHQEDTPSFKVENSLVWFDHAIGKGGNIIDFVMCYYNLDFKRSLQKISDVWGSVTQQVKTTDTFFLQQQKNINKIKNFANSSSNDKNGDAVPTIKKIQELQNPSLIKYLESRKIDINIAKKYLKEIYWINHKSNKSNFGLAFENDKKGYEVRNSILKLNLGGKALTTIKGTDLSKLSIFEGFMDFLSALTYYKLESFKSTVIVLNSLALIDNHLELLNAPIVYSFLDNDKAGKLATQKIFNSGVNLVDCSNIYKNSKDFNEYIN